MGIMTREYQYDAFVIYNPVGKDLQFVKELSETMEAPPYNFRFFVPWRDDVTGSVGVNQYLTVTADLIENRCRKAIAVLSHNFWKSETTLFQLNHAQCVSPGNRLKKIIPICLDDCTIPIAIKQITRIHYNKTDMKDWFWSRVSGALRRPDDVTESCDPFTCAQKSLAQDSVFPDKDTIPVTSESHKEEERGISEDFTVTPNLMSHVSVTQSSLTHNSSTQSSGTASGVHLPDIVLDTPNHVTWEK